MSSKIKIKNPIEAYLQSKTTKERRLLSDYSEESYLERKEQKLDEFEAYLRLSESVRMTLIPANDLYLDKKDFTW